MNLKNQFSQFVVFFLLFIFPFVASSQEDATSQTVTSTTTEIQTSAEVTVNPASEIIRIKELQVQVQDTLKQQESALQAASATPIVEAYKKQVESINNLFLTHSQQISAYENRITLGDELKQIKADQETLNSVTESASVSFLELNNLREQVNTEINREQSIDSKIEVADTALKQAKEAVQQRQSQVNDLQVQVDNAPDEDQKSALQLELIAANFALRTANERVILLQIERENENLNKEVYQTRTTLLKKQLEHQQSNVEFTKEHLDEQLNRLDKLKFDLEKQRQRLTTQQSNIDLRLQAVKNKVAQTAEPPQSMLDERKARELESRSISNQNELFNDQIQLIPTHTLLWNRRYDVFNHNVEKSVMTEWKTEANGTITNLNQSDRGISLELDILQNDLITLRNALTNLTSEQQDRKRWLDEQETHYQTIINSFRDQQNFIEVTRRLTAKLVNEIDQVLSVQTWQEYVDTLLKKQLYSNTYKDWLFAACIAVVIFIILFVVRWVLLNRIQAYEKKRKTPIVAGILDVIQRTRPTFFFVWSLFIASTYLKFSDETESLLLSFMLFALTMQGAIMASYFMQTFIKNFFAKKAKYDQANASAMAIINFISQLIVWSLALYLGLESFDIEATPLITGLGIGGLAVALALQNILSDLFASLSIVIDKPFVVGDFIILDTYMGSVEHIGIKTTRIRSLSGEQIICANGDLLNSRIRNFKRMHERRIAFTIGVTYQTTHEQLKTIPGIIKEIIEQNELVRFDRSHFKDFGDFSLNFETIYFVTTSDMAIYMDIQQRINLELYKRFSESNIEFAYPTQTLFVEKTNPAMKGNVNEMVE